jgi:mono/diheme cytochrome c family protein
MRTVLKLLGVLVVLILAALLFILSGVYDVAASSPDSGLVAWVLRTTQSRSVHRAYERLEGKVTIPNLDDPERIRTGLILYSQNCATCHGAPGVKLSAIGQGLNPYPPELAAEGGDEPLELFWVTKNGIKMTGMPSFGVTHSDEEIWAVVAFLRRMGKLSPEEYQAMAEPSPPRPSSPDPSLPPLTGRGGRKTSQD